jgi:hypothetical protein
MGKGGFMDRIARRSAAVVVRGSTVLRREGVAEWDFTKGTQSGAVMQVARCDDRGCGSARRDPWIEAAIDFRRTMARVTIRMKSAADRAATFYGRIFP